MSTESGEIDACDHVPVLVRGAAWGNLYLCEKAGGETDLERILELILERGRTLIGGRGGDDDEQLLEAFASSATTAVATARRVEEQRRRDAMRASEEERRRWARELHDDTLQSLGGLRMLLAAARRGGDREQLGGAVDEAIERIEDEINGLRRLIRELWPAALDELGPAAAIEDLAARASERHGIAVTADVRLDSSRYPPELETALYRIVQEALTNALRHANPRRIAIEVAHAGEVIHATVRDDGRGFDPAAPRDGFGLTGMRERVALLHGVLELSSSTHGTAITAVIPVP